MSFEWYALAVQPRKEQYVERQLIGRGYSAVCPRYKKVVRHARQTKTVLAPLFPGYLFVEMNLEQCSWRKVNWVPGSIGLVKTDNRPASLSREFVSTVILALDQGGSIAFKHDLKMGDQVRAVGGPFDALMGEVVGLSDNERVKILLDAVNRKVEMTLPRTAVVVAA